jgi:cytochrome c biogenesis protein CcmG, thiol:disulfide interchange protein DsbE
VRKAIPTLRSGILFLAACTLSLTACDRGDHPNHIGSQASPFTLTDDTQTIDLSHFRGHVVIVNFWATWCPPCIDELPSLLALQRRLPQVTVLAISQDENPDAYRAFLLQNHVDLLTLRDPSARIPHLYGTLKIPESYVIDRNGILRRKFVSAQNWTSPEILDYLTKL